MWMIQDGAEGIWKGYLSWDEEQGDTHGLWTIGNSQSLKGTPGFTNKLWYKTWISSPEKYGGKGHRVASGAHGGRHEFVLVMEGCLACTCNKKTHELEFPECVELLPNQSRTWKLPKDKQRARGITICRFRYPTKDPVRCGSGKGYELRIIADDVCRLNKSVKKTKRCRWIYTEVFCGRVLLKQNKPGGEQWIIYPKVHIFIPVRSQDKFTFEPIEKLPFRAVQIFF